MLMQREDIMSQIVDPTMLDHLYEVRSCRSCRERKCKLFRFIMMLINRPAFLVLDRWREDGPAIARSTAQTVAKRADLR